MFMAPLLTSMGMAASTAATVGTVASVVGAAMTVLGGVSQANAANAAAKYNAESARNAAQTNKNMLDAKATQEEAVSQAAATQKRKDLELRLSRAYAVAASQGGGAPPESLIRGLIDKGETAAWYDLYSGTEKAKTLRFQGESGLDTAIRQGDANVAHTKSAANATIMGSVVKGASMLSFAPGAPPGIDAGVTDYTGSYTRNGPFDARTFSGQIYD